MRSYYQGGRSVVQQWGVYQGHRMAGVLGVRHMRVASRYMSYVSYGGHMSYRHGGGGGSVRPHQVAVGGGWQHGVQQGPGGRRGAGG